MKGKKNPRSEVEGKCSNTKGQKSSKGQVLRTNSAAVKGGNLGASAEGVSSAKAGMVLEPTKTLESLT